ncbi:fumarate/nitrate reduction transcriptional regulator Fnr [Burkholderia cepacia]|uniref:Fumarate/nitrate reduction transcriptional regulator Fnr n=1 Tax=Burkholderia cepacia TaxID=292 RepID=A0ABM6P046_BURCE|nr:fumarate/nitrate reduction transcriptional regulator Fnr [Burkholderia cepacia]AIO26890.1 cyclic nucleotide-binding domain protein [Burkholderia cepacia ATCC 25416]ALK23529.1 Crp/Fnr family transcriptional regulator [Burkholderia cepacia ATCC 25416]ASE93170.1 fumarate/nitrate reduction transcriptional regulator Fnr [Burkholderia cepacia]ATF80538.1 fumarate/nitrate reduction transcriptional regulator Fnr [Burkholderia cepacia]MCA8469773.1 fumarate/nitrate reduction transcriptional regulator 
MQSHADVSQTMPLHPLHPLQPSRPFIPLHPVERADQPKRAASRCSTCALRTVCMPPDLSPDDFARVDAMICTTRHVRRGETLFRAGDAFNSIYAVRTGSFKTIVMHRDGDEQITGFQIVGESLGLDGVHTGRHNGDAIALEDSTVCIIPFGQLEQMCRDVRPMQHHVYQMMSGEIVRESAQMLLLGTMTAEQRVAAFLLNLSTRFKARGYSAAEFVLRMTRDEIGEYLGMKLETVSRMMSKFQRKGLVAAQGKQIRIVDSDGLGRI